MEVLPFVILLEERKRVDLLLAELLVELEELKKKADRPLPPL